MYFKSNKDGVLTFQRSQDPQRYSVDSFSTDLTLEESFTPKAEK